MCHMPARETTMPHVAFTHHQIGIHPLKSEPVASEDIDRLAPLFDLSDLSDGERQRSLGLARENLLARDGPEIRRTIRWREAAAQVEDALTRLPPELVDAWVLAALTELYFFRGDMSRAAETGLEVLRMESARARARIQVLNPLGTAAYAAGRYSEAAKHFSELARMRQNANDWFSLGMCELKLQRDEAALNSFRTALQFELSSVPIRERMAEIYHSRRDFDAEMRLRDEIKRLTQAPRSSR